MNSLVVAGWRACLRHFVADLVELAARALTARDRLDQSRCQFGVLSGDGGWVGRGRWRWGGERVLLLL